MMMMMMMMMMMIPVKPALGEGGGGVVIQFSYKVKGANYIVKRFRNVTKHFGYGL